MTGKNDKPNDTDTKASIKKTASTDTKEAKKQAVDKSQNTGKNTEKHTKTTDTHNSDMEKNDTPPLNKDSSANSTNNKQAEESSNMDTKSKPSVSTTPKDTTSSDAPQKSASPRQTDNNKNKKGNIASIISLILCLIILLFIMAAAYFGWTFWQEQNQRLQSIESQVSQQTNQSQQSSRSLQQQEAQFNQLKKQQQQRFSDMSQTLSNDQRAAQQRLDAHAEQLKLLSGTNRNGWMLEEVRYLLRLANQRQLTSGDVQGIIGLLKSADAILHTVDDPELFPIRDRLNKEIIALRLAPDVDREGLYLQLSALISQVEQLQAVPFKGALAATKAKEQEKQLATNASAAWYERVGNSISHAFGSLDRYVQINHADDTSQPLISDLQKSAMQQSLRLMLEQSQIALLREETIVYKQSLEKVIVWLNAHYGHYPQKQALIEQIQTLQRQRIVRELPDTKRSLALLVQHIERYKNPAPQVPEKQTSEANTENTNKTVTTQEVQPLQQQSPETAL